MHIYPAIDLKDGQVVRLTQGDYARMEIYSSDPVEMARSFVASGATHLHVVDLDGAKDGTTTNFKAIRDILSVGGLFVQVGGGLRDGERIQRYLDMGVNRAILGTVAVTDFSFVRSMIRRYGDKIAVGVDARDGLVAVRGWQETTQVNAIEFCQKLDLSNINTIIYTDISRDGAMQGCNIAIYEHLTQFLHCNLIASGGVSSMEDILALRRLGLHGAILGKAMYTGKLELKEVLAKC